MRHRRSSLDRHPHQRGFTLRELLVIVAVLGLLGLLVLPALADAAERSLRTACLNNLRRLGIAATIYAGNHDGVYLSARNGVQITLLPPEPGAAARAGLIEGAEVSRIWTCPNRPDLPVFDPGFSQWLIGYQYFGGITTWRNPLGIFPSRSPVRLDSAQPHWALAADPIIQIDGEWGGGRSSLYEGMPQHHGAESMVPEGGNQVFVDGSAQWIKFEQMQFLHSWSPSGERRAYFYQDPKDFPTELTSIDPRTRKRALSAEP